MTEKLLEQLTNLIEPILQKRNAFLVEIHVRVGHKRKTVQVFVDTDTGITIDECAEISRDIGSALDSNEIIEGAYDLEVSSPGLEKPLKNLRQFPRNVGRLFTVTYQEGQETHSFVGTLEKVEGTKIFYRLPNNEERSLEFENIVATTVKLPW